jgi:hypothetical protein
VPSDIDTFLLTALQDADAIARQVQRCANPRGPARRQRRADAVATAARRAADAGLVQVIHVTGPEALAQALDVAPWVDALLLDSGNPMLAVKELGGTGRTHDWTQSRRIRDSVAPAGLAGRRPGRTQRRRGDRGRATAWPGSVQWRAPRRPARCEPAARLLRRPAGVGCVTSAMATTTLGEFDLIARYFTRAPRRAVLGIGDDCALLAPAGRPAVAVSSDMLSRAGTSCRRCDRNGSATRRWR